MEKRKRSEDIQIDFLGMTVMVIYSLAYAFSFLYTLLSGSYAYALEALIYGSIGFWLGFSVLKREKHAIPRLKAYLIFLIYLGILNLLAGNLSPLLVNGIIPALLLWYLHTSKTVKRAFKEGGIDYKLFAALFLLSLIFFAIGFYSAYLEASRSFAVYLVDQNYNPVEGAIYFNGTYLGYTEGGVLLIPEITPGRLIILVNGNESLAFEYNVTEEDIAQGEIVLVLDLSS